MHAKPTHAYIAQKPCGCLSLISSDILALRADAAAALARAIIAGHVPGYVTHAKAHALPWRCDRCADSQASQVPDTPLELDAASTRPDAPCWRITGSITYEVTVPVSVTVQADDAQQATDAVFEAMQPTCLLIKLEEITVEWSSDDLDATEVAKVAAGQLSLGLA